MADIADFRYMSDDGAMTDKGVLSKEQEVMERRFSLPYNWCKAPHSRHIRQKTGIWRLAHELAGDISKKRVLDAGCGDGWYSEKMRAAGARVTGADYSERAIEFAKIILPDVSFHAASILALPFDDRSFDVVFSFQVLEHLEPKDVDQAVGELARVLRSGGIAVVSVPSLRRKQSAAHYQHFSKETLDAAFSPHFTVERIVGQDRRTSFLWLCERLLQNRLWTLDSLAYKFNSTVYLSRYNRTTPECGDNLMIVARKK